MKMKISAIGQAIIQAARPRAVLAPLQLAFGMQMHHHFRSRYLIESLHNLGSSYKEILKFERSSAMISGAELEELLEDGSSVKFSADNVDHNICTIDGRNTFHGMGMIASVTKGKFNSKEVPRITVSDNELLKKSAVPILPFKDRKDLLKGLKYLSPEAEINSIVSRPLVESILSFQKSDTNMVWIYAINS